MANYFSRPCLSLLAIALLSAGGHLGASEASSPEMRMREQLKATMLQLRDAQTQVVTLQASLAESDQKNKALVEQVASLTKRLAADKDTADKTIADLKSKLENREAKIAELGDSLDKWKVSQKQAVELATAKESQRAKLAADVITLQQHVDDQRVKNQGMFKLGTEILTRYEKFGLGEALAAREPFTGIAKVKFQALVQDYQDKLVDQKIKPAQGGSVAPSQGGPGSNQKQDVKQGVHSKPESGKASDPR